jgi:hypothetical protein
MYKVDFKIRRSLEGPEYNQENSREAGCNRGTLATGQLPFTKANVLFCIDSPNTATARQHKTDKNTICVCHHFLHTSSLMYSHKGEDKRALGYTCFLNISKRTSKGVWN